MLLEDVIHFLGQVPPFQFLDPLELERVARDVFLEFYPKNTVVLKQNGPPSECLRIIKKGTVKVSMAPETGEEIVLEYKGEGDNFGFLSLIGKDRQRTTVKAVEDTLCYILNKERVHRLLESNPAFTEYFMAYLSQYVDRTFQEMHQRNPFYGSSDRLLFTTPVGAIAIPLITVPEEASIQEAAQVMARHKISSLVIRNRNNLPTGIITDRDLREKVVAKGRSFSESAKNISNLSLIRVDGRDTCFEALLKMVQYNIHHLLVVEEGALKGIITNHDLMLLQGTSPLSLANDILNQQTVEGLIPLTRKLFNIIGLLLKEDIPLAHLSNILTEIYDRLFRRILEIGEMEIGPPPLPYCLVVLGSEGRREQIFKTDQDNVLIYSDPPDPAEAGAAEGYFTGLSQWLRDSLVRLGVPSCPDGHMAANPQWRHPFRDWKKIFEGWITQAGEETLAASLPFFDSRPLYGKFSLFLGIRDLVHSTIPAGNRNFLKRLARLAVKNPPPVGFVKDRVVEKDGTQHEALDLKQRGILPLVDLVRLLALARGIRETSSLGRIKALQQKDSILQKIGGEVTQAFQFMMLMNIHHQYQQIKEGEPPDPMIRPDRLSNLEKKTFREAFRLTARLQDLVKKSFVQEN